MAELSTDYYLLRNTAGCVSYEPSMSDIFWPPMIIFSQLCVSTDRTTLFLVSLVRLLFYVVLYEVINDMINIEKYRIIRYPLLIIIIINIICVGGIVSKPTIFSFGSKDPVSVAKPYNLNTI